MIRATREHLANILPEHGEKDLAKRVLTITDAELERIGELGAYYAWSEEAFELGLGMEERERSAWRRSTCSKGICESCASPARPGASVGVDPELSDVELAQEHSLRLRATTTKGQPPSDA